MFEFLSVQFKLGKVGEHKLQIAVEKGFLSLEQKNIIIQEKS